MATPMQAQDAAKTAMYAALGVPLVTGRAFMQLGEKIGADARTTFGEIEFDDPSATGKLFVDLSGKLTVDTLTALSGLADLAAWVTAGREMTGQIQENIHDRKMIEQVQNTVEDEIEQIQDTVGVLREQLEEALTSWRDQFAPSVRRPDRSMKVKVQKTDETVAKKAPAAKKTTARKTTAKKTTKPKTTPKTTAKKTTAKATTKPKTTAAKKPTASE